MIIERISVMLGAAGAPIFEWGGVSLGWRELSGVGVSCLVIYLSYALKESLQTKKHEHMTRQEKPS